MIEHDIDFLSTYFLKCRIDHIIFGWNWLITNYGRFINQFPPNIVRSIRQFERINKKICRQKMSLMFNQIYIYIYIYRERERERVLERKIFSPSILSLSLSLCLSPSVYIFMHTLPFSLSLFLSLFLSLSLTDSNTHTHIYR